MAIHLVTGYAGKEHIKSEDQGSFNASFFGTGQFVMEAGNQLAASIIDNNTVRILDGDILMQGRHIRINTNTYEDMTIENGTAGVNRCDLIVMEYSKDSATGIESAALKVIKGAEVAGTASAPSYTEGNILSGAVINQMPLYKISVEGVVLMRIEQLFVTIPTYKALAERYAKEFQTACKTHLDSLSVLDTLEEVEANTQENQLAGALSLKELSAELKKSVSDGKSLVAGAITGKGVETAADAEFAVMAENIGKIILGSGNAEPENVDEGMTFTNDSGIEQVGTSTAKADYAAYKNAVISGLAYSNLGLTLESTPEEIYAALAAAFPDSFAFYPNNQILWNGSVWNGICSASCSGEEEENYITCSSAKMDVTNYAKLIWELEVYRSVSYGSGYAEIYVYQNDTAVHFERLTDSGNGTTARKIEVDLSRVTGEIWLKAVCHVTSNTDAASQARITTTSIKLV